MTSSFSPQQPSARSSTGSRRAAGAGAGTRRQTLGRHHRGRRPQRADLRRLPGAGRQAGARAGGARAARRRLHHRGNLARLSRLALRVFVRAAPSPRDRRTAHGRLRPALDAGCRRACSSPSTTAAASNCGTTMRTLRGGNSPLRAARCGRLARHERHHAPRPRRAAPADGRRHLALSPPVAPDDRGAAQGRPGGAEPGAALVDGRVCRALSARRTACRAPTWARA
jgi:hypothetical protein